MIIKGRCRGNGVQLAAYLLDIEWNERAEWIAGYGSAIPSNLKLSLLEMSLSSEITGRSKRGLYHCQLSPRIDEAEVMTIEQKLRMIEILTKNLGMPENVKWQMTEQEKDGRIHFHLAYERYNHETRTMWDDQNNYAKHNSASREMEKEFGWKLTYEKTNRLDRGIKDFIWDTWHKDDDPIRFIKEMEKAGLEVTQGIDRRPFQIVDLHGTEFDLTRQIDGVTQKEVSQRLNEIRKTLRTTPEACKSHREEAQRLQALANEKIKESDKTNELSDSQDLANSMINSAKLNKEINKEAFEKVSYNLKFTQELVQSPALLQDLNLKNKSDKNLKLSDNEDRSIKQRQEYLDRLEENEKKLRQAMQNGREQTQKNRESDLSRDSYDY